MKALNFMIILSFFTAISSGCSGFSNRTFIDQMDADEGGMFAPGESFPIVSGDRGRTHRTHDEMMARTPASEREKSLNRYDRSASRELERRVNNLSEREYSEYRIHEQYLSTNAEKIYYLDLSYRERADYIRLKGHNPSTTEMEMREARQFASTSNRFQGGFPQSESRSPASSSGAQSLGHEPAYNHMGMSFYETRSSNENPIRMGMSKDQVMRNWGQPSDVAVAGHPRYENERWSYFVAGQSRKVYFSSGRVEGWELD